MASFNLLLLPGDGIGPEVMGEAEAIVAWFTSQGIARFEIERGHLRKTSLRFGEIVPQGTDIVPAGESEAFAHGKGKAFRCLRCRNLTQMQQNVQNA